MKKSIIIISTTIALLSSGCSVFNSTPKTTVSGGEATKATEKVSNRPTQKAIDGNADKNNPTAGADTSHPKVILPGNPESPSIAPAQPKKSTLTDLGKVLGGTWTIIEAASTPIDRDDNMPYIVFVPGEGAFYANNGCNTLNGTYTLDGDKLSFHNVLTTMRLCPDVTFDHDINVIVCDQTSTPIKITEVGSETYVDFLSSTGKSLMRLRRPNLEFLNGQWDITEVRGLAQLKTPATIFFDLTAMELHGNTGCNFINGTLYLDHRKANAIDISNIITTLRACENPEQQTSILVALEETSTAVSDGPDKAILLDNNGTILLELKKAK